MKNIFSLKKALLGVMLFVSIFAFAKEKIAVAEPRTAGGLSPEDLAGISDYIESKLGGNYDIFSRASLSAMLKEDAFNQSGLVLDADVRHQLAQQAVDCLFTYSISKLGSRLSMTLMVIDCSTGEIRKNQRYAITAPSIDALVTRLDTALEKMGLLQGKAENDEIKRVVLLPFSNNAEVSEAIANDMNVKLASFLLKSGSVEILSRADLDAISKESRFVDSDLADPGQLSKIAQLKVADYLVNGEIVRFENRLITQETTIAGASSGRQQMTIQLNLRIIDIKTGKVIAQESIRQEMKSTDIPAISRQNWTEADYNNAFMEKSAVVVGNRLLERIDPIRVAAADDSGVYLTRGAGAGIFPGTRFIVCNPGRKILHPVTKKELGTTEEKAALIEVVEVVPDMSIAKIIGKAAAPIKEGAICRSTETSETDTQYGIKPAETTPPAYPMAN